MFGIMAKMGVSVTTGYDWTHTSSETMSEEQTIEVDATAWPGQILTIEQGNSPKLCHSLWIFGHPFSSFKTDLHYKIHATSRTWSAFPWPPLPPTMTYMEKPQAVGHCDGNDAQTELFKFTNSTRQAWTIVFISGSGGDLDNFIWQHVNGLNSEAWKYVNSHHYQKWNLLSMLGTTRYGRVLDVSYVRHLPNGTTLITK